MIIISWKCEKEIGISPNKTLHNNFVTCREKLPFFFDLCLSEIIFVICIRTCVSCVDRAAKMKFSAIEIC